MTRSGGRTAFELWGTWVGRIDWNGGRRRCCPLSTRGAALQCRWLLCPLVRNAPIAAQSVSCARNASSLVVALSRSSTAADASALGLSLNQRPIGNSGLPKGARPGRPIANHGNGRASGCTTAVVALSLRTDSAGRDHQSAARHRDDQGAAQPGKVRIVGAS